MLVADVGPLVAAAARRERNHTALRRAALADAASASGAGAGCGRGGLLLGRPVGVQAEQAFARSLREGELLVEPVEPADWARIVELLDEYGDLPLGIVDASVVAACERLGATTPSWCRRG